MKRRMRHDPRAPFGVRIGDDERRLLEVAAFQCRESVGAFIRRAALDAARRELGKEGHSER